MAAEDRGSFLDPSFPKGGKASPMASGTSGASMHASSTSGVGGSSMNRGARTQTGGTGVDQLPREMHDMKIRDDHHGDEKVNSHA